MSNYIHLTKPPTKEDYFKAKLYGVPFYVTSYEDIIKFDLIDFNHKYPFKIGAYKENTGKYFRIWDVEFKNDVNVLVQEHVVGTEEFYFVDSRQYDFVFNKPWLEKNYPDIYQKFSIVHIRIYSKAPRR